MLLSEEKYPPTKHMSWEVVKGFCRRRTQQIRENLQHASKTEDGEFDALHAKATAMVASTQRMSSRLVAVLNDLKDIIDNYSKLKDDLLSDSLLSADLQSTGKKVELASNDFNIKYAPLEQVFQESLRQFQKYHNEASTVEALVDDRKTKMLEYDFFRNKLASLRAAPPADTSRIPRNEGRLMDWQQAYEESNMKAKKFFLHLIETGEQMIASGTNVLTNDVSRFFGEVSKTQRVLFLGSRLADEATNMMSTVQQAAANTAQQVAAAATVQIVTNPSSRRFFMADDPFRSD